MLFKLGEFLFCNKHYPQRLQCALANLDWFTTFGLHNRVMKTPNDYPVVCGGIERPNPIALGSLVDINAKAVAGWGALGFGSVEIGPVSLRPKARTMAGLKESNGNIAFQGIWGNEGADAVLKNLRSAESFVLRNGIVGVALDPELSFTYQDGAKRVSFDIESIVACAEKLSSKCRYFTIDLDRNSEDIFAGTSLADILEGLASSIPALAKLGKPVCVKFSGTIPLESAKAIAAKCIECGAAGCTVAAARVASDAVTLIGTNHFEANLACVKALHEEFGEKLDITACGGIADENDALKYFEAGASLVQIDVAAIIERIDLCSRCVSAAEKSGLVKTSL